MPFGPSDLPWWGWLLCAAIAGTVSAAISARDEKSEKGVGCFSLLLMLLFGVAACVTASIGVIRFVKWVWNG